MSLTMPAVYRPQMISSFRLQSIQGIFLTYVAFSYVFEEFAI